GALDLATNLPFRVHEQVDRQLGVDAGPGVAHPLLAFAPLAQPVGAVERARLEEASELPLVVIERHEDHTEARFPTREPFLPALEPWDFLLTGCAPRRPEVHPGPLTAPRGNGLGLGIGAARDGPGDASLRQRLAILAQLPVAQRLPRTRRGGARCDRGDRRRARLRRRGVALRGLNRLAALARHHRRALLLVARRAEQEERGRERRGAESTDGHRRQSTHDTKALRLMASSSHFSS